MPMFRIRIHQAVWQTVEFACNAPSEQDARDNAFDYEERLMESDPDAIETITDDSVEGIDTEIEVEPIHPEAPR